MTSFFHDAPKALSDTQGKNSVLRKKSNNFKYLCGLLGVFSR